MSLDTETDVLEALDFKQDLPCEHTQHDKLIDHHEGIGKWYAKHVCNNCGYTSGIKLICNRFATFVMTGLEMMCLECHAPTYGLEDYVIWEMKR